MCRFYNVSRSGYYSWKNKEKTPSEDQEIVDIINECHTENKRRYGYRRVVLWLRREKGVILNHKKVLRIMNKYNMLSATRRRRLHRYRPNGDLHYANILNRDFHAEYPNQKWVTDISYIILPDGTLYLSAIRDLYDQFIVAYKTAKRQDYDLVGRTIRAALDTENPKQKILMHSDGGGQYRSFNYRDDTQDAEITASMSKPGTPGDNALAENFFSIFKSECIYLEKPQTVADADQMTSEFVDYYNYKRLQLTGWTPWETRRDYFNMHPNQ